MCFINCKSEKNRLFLIKYNSGDSLTGKRKRYSRAATSAFLQTHSISAHFLFAVNILNMFYNLPDWHDVILLYTSLYYPFWHGIIKNIRCSLKQQTVVFLQTINKNYKRNTIYIATDSITNVMQKKSDG